MKTTEEIYQTLLAAFAQRAGFTPEADCDLAVRLYAAAAAAAGPGHPERVGAGPELSPDGPGRVSGLPRPDAWHRPDGGHEGGGNAPLFCGAGAVHGSEHRRRNGLHDGGRDPVPNHGGGGAGSRGAVRGCSGGGLEPGRSGNAAAGDHRDPHRLPGGDHRMHQSGALYRRQ